MMNRKRNGIFILFAVSLLFGSCVPTKKFEASQLALQAARNDSALLAAKVSNLETQVSEQKEEISRQKGQISDLNDQVNQLNNKAGLLSTNVANKESQLTTSQQQLADQQKRLEQLQSLMDQQKKATQEIRKKMADALVGFNSNELTVAIKNGKVYVSLQENPVSYTHLRAHETGRNLVCRL